MNYQLIESDNGDERWLEQLRRDVYQELFQATFGGWDNARHKRHFSAFLEGGNIFLIHVDGLRVGMVQLWKQDNVVNIGEIQVQRSLQSHGIGSKILRDVIAEAKRNGQVVHLKTGLKNEGALRLYKRLGFQVVETTETHFHMEHDGN